MFSEWPANLKFNIFKYYWSSRFANSRRRIRDNWYSLKTGFLWTGWYGNSHL